MPVNDNKSLQTKEYYQYKKQTNKQTTTITKNPKPVYRGWDQDLFYSGSESYHSNFDNLEYLLPKQKLLPITSKTLLNSIQL